MGKLNKPVDNKKLNKPANEKEKNIVQATKDIKRAAQILSLVKGDNKNQQKTSARPPTKKEKEKQEKEKKLEKLNKELSEEIEWRDKAVAQVFREGRKMGAPTKLTEQVIKDAEMLARLGLAEIAIADSLCIAPLTFSRWKKKNKNFSTRLKVARNTGKSKLVNSLYGHGRVQWQAHAWLLERMYRDEFGLNQKVEVTGKGGEPVTFNVVYKEAKNAETKSTTLG